MYQSLSLSEAFVRVVDEVPGNDRLLPRKYRFNESAKLLCDKDIGPEICQELSGDFRDTTSSSDTGGLGAATSFFTISRAI